MRTAAVGLVMMMSAVALSAHVTVQPKESAAESTQQYTVRVPAEAAVPSVSIELEVPAGIVVQDVPAGAAYSVDTRREGGRIVAVVWTQEVKPKEVAQFTFTAMNPAAAGEVRWRAHQRYADGTVVHWVGVEGDRRPASVTRMTAAVHAH